MRKRNYRRRKTYRPKGKKLEGFQLSSFTYPYLVYLAYLFGILTIPFVWGAFNVSLVLRELFLFLAGLSALMVIVFAVQRRQQARLLNQIHTIEALRKINPVDFEYYVANLLRHHGFKRLKVRGGAGDRGVDIDVLPNLPSFIS